MEKKVNLQEIKEQEDVVLVFKSLIISLFASVLWRSEPSLDREMQQGTKKIWIGDCYVKLEKEV